MSLPVLELSNNDLVKIVQDAYDAKAQAKSRPFHAKAVADAFGYTPEQLQSIPDEALMGLSCGNPVVTATIKEEETVIDLGSGGGIDVLLAAAKVGAKGQAIGLDLSPNMIALARRNAKKQNLTPPQVAFVQASLTETLPIASNSVDCVLSNCVVNLLPKSGKGTLLKEVHRVLKPGGRIVLDDIIAKEALPSEIRDDLTSYINCISGAIQLPEYISLLNDAGFADPLFVEAKHDLNVYYKADPDSASVQSCCQTNPASPRPPQTSLDANKWVASYQIYAVKAGFAIEGSPPSALIRWWDAYPTTKSSPPSITPDEVVTLIRDSTKQAPSFAVIDVRRNDHGGGHVRGSHQWAAQTFYDDLPAFYEKFHEISVVIFYCGSSSGRGPRCAGWYQDYLDETGMQTSKAYVLQGGVKAWLAKFSNDQDLTDRD